MIIMSDVINNDAYIILQFSSYVWDYLLKVEMIDFIVTFKMKIYKYSMKPHYFLSTL